MVASLGVYGALTAHAAKSGRLDACSKAGNPLPLGRGLGLRHMGTVVKFPDEGRVVHFGPADAADQSATIIILPVVRIERHERRPGEGIEPSSRPPATSGRRRRARRR
jgi:hypothetical protein